MVSLRVAVLFFALACATAGQSYTFSNLAGGTGGAGSDDGDAAHARFHYPSGVAVDSDGTIYVADAGNHTIRKINRGSVSTLAGLAGEWGGTDATGGYARFNQPEGIAVDGRGNIYVADAVNGAIRTINRDGVVRTLARTGIVYAIAADRDGNVYVARNVVQKITADGVVTTIAGVADLPGYSDGTGSIARFNDAMALAVDGDGTIFVADSGNHTIRKVTPSGVVTTIAGLAGTSGAADGNGPAARFKRPSGIAVARDLFTSQTPSTARSVESLPTAPSVRSLVRPARMEPAMAWLVRRDSAFPPASRSARTARSSSPTCSTTPFVSST